MTIDSNPSVRLHMTGDGEVTIADTVIAKLASRAARSTYGVAGMRQSPLRRLARFLPESSSDGIRVECEQNDVRVVLHVVLESGVSIAAVTRAIEERVRYELEQVAGIVLREVVVHVEDLH